MHRDTVLHFIREYGALSDRVLDGLRADWPHQTELLPGLMPFLGDLEAWLKQLDAVSTDEEGKQETEQEPQPLESPIQEPVKEILAPVSQQKKKKKVSSTKKGKAAKTFKSVFKKASPK